jgi:hypothetical protein
MKDFAAQAKTALSILLQRGDEALAFLEDGRDADAENRLLWQRAAFHNFCALDAKARKSGVDLKDDAEIVMLNVKIQNMLGRQEKKIERAMIKNLSVAAQLAKSKQQIGKYRSGTIEQQLIERLI